MKYREITAVDTQELARIFAEAFNSEPWFEKWTQKTAERRIGHYINNEGFFGLAAIEDGKIIGMVIGEEEQYFDGIVCVIKEFCVRKAFRGKGIGTELLHEYEKREVARGIRSISLDTTVEDEDFYARRGYLRSEDMILMGKEL